jgi:hypothetical protein
MLREAHAAAAEVLSLQQPPIQNNKFFAASLPSHTPV